MRFSIATPYSTIFFLPHDSLPADRKSIRQEISGLLCAVGLEANPHNGICNVTSERNLYVDKALLCILG